MNLDNVWYFVLGMGTMYVIVLWLSRNDTPMQNEVKQSTAEIWVKPEPKTNPNNRTQLIAGITVRQACKLASHIQRGGSLTYRAIKLATGISEEKWEDARIDLVGRGMARYGSRNTLVLMDNWHEWILEQLSPTPHKPESIVTIPGDRRNSYRQSPQSPVGGWKPIKKGWKP